ncbi:MAG: (S)-ureidoglycine aminohydrolase [Isosphaeraceae bacterium]
MEIFGTTRSRVRRSHALIAPESFVRSDLPGWDQTQGIILISPRMGARFTQYLALMEKGGTAGPAPPSVERVIYVLDGEISLSLPHSGECRLGTGGYAYGPPGFDLAICATAPARLNIFEKRYATRPGIEVPGALCGNEGNVEGAPFLGDPDAILKVLLPRDPRFDLAVNVFTYERGATLPLVEVHVMEHGLLMLEGQGVYRLGDDWYPVRQGDCIWMAPFCPQWFVAMGKGPARYLYYKDVNRDPLEEDE